MQQVVRKTVVFETGQKTAVLYILHSNTIRVSEHTMQIAAYAGSVRN
jgi:hypothetical protein